MSCLYLYSSTYTHYHTKHYSTLFILFFSPLFIQSTCLTLPNLRYLPVLFHIRQLPYKTPFNLFYPIFFQFLLNPPVLYFTKSTLSTRTLPHTSTPPQSIIPLFFTLFSSPFTLHITPGDSHLTITSFTPSIAPHQSDLTSSLSSYASNLPDPYDLPTFTSPLPFFTSQWRVPHHQTTCTSPFSLALSPNQALVIPGDHASGSQIFGCHVPLYQGESDSDPAFTAVLFLYSFLQHSRLETRVHRSSIREREHSGVLYAARNTNRSKGQGAGDARCCLGRLRIGWGGINTITWIFSSSRDSWSGNMQEFGYLGL